MKYLSIIKYILLLISAAVVLVVAVTFVDDGNESIPLNLMLGWAGLMVLLTIALTIVMPIRGVLQNPKSAIGGLIGLGLIAVVILISYVMASDEPITLASKKIIEDSFTLKFADTALYATYIVFGGVIASLVFGELYKAFKN